MFQMLFFLFINLNRHVNCDWKKRRHDGKDARCRYVCWKPLKDHKTQSIVQRLPLKFWSWLCTAIQSYLKVVFHQPRCAAQCSSLMFVSARHNLWKQIRTKICAVLRCVAQLCARTNVIRLLSVLQGKQVFARIWLEQELTNSLRAQWGYFKKKKANFPENVVIV